MASAPTPRLLPGAFTVELYHKLGELGVFHEDDRVELLDGQIVEMSPIGSQHAACVNRLTMLLARGTTGPVTVSPQNPVVLDARWEPQPDIALLRRVVGLPRPGDVLLIVEVADTSLDRDRDYKLPRYAAVGIPETWIVDLNAPAITVYRDPTPSGYRTSFVARRGDSLRPALLEEVELAVSDILG
jgi:Uma2 family endonuclease